MSIRVSAIKRGVENENPRPGWTLKSLVILMQLLLGFLKDEKFVFGIFEDCYWLWRVKSKTRMCHKWKWDMKSLCNMSEIIASIFFLKSMAPCPQDGLSASCIKSVWMGSTSKSHRTSLTRIEVIAGRGLRSNPHRNRVNESEKLAKNPALWIRSKWAEFSQVWNFLEGNVPSLMHEAHLHKPWVLELRIPTPEGKVETQECGCRSCSCWGALSVGRGCRRVMGGHRRAGWEKGCWHEPGSVSCSFLSPLQMCTCGQGWVQLCRMAVPARLLSPYWALLATELLWCFALQVYWRKNTAHECPAWLLWKETYVCASMGRIWPSAKSFRVFNILSV